MHEHFPVRLCSVRAARIGALLAACTTGAVASESIINQHPASEPTFASVTVDDRGFVITSPDKKSRFKLGGRVQLDIANGGVGGRDYTNALNQRGELRRGYIKSYFTLFDAIEGAFQYNLAPGDTQPYKDVVLSVRGGPFMASIGNMSEPMGQEELAGANNFTFLEQALMTALVPGALAGVSLWCRRRPLDVCSRNIRRQYQ